MIKAGLLYAPTHEWLAFEGKIASVGISDHAQESLGDIVYIELPAVGKSFKKGETFGAIESVKAASDLYLPVSGKIVEVNNALEDAPETINADPYGAWIVKIEVLDESESISLLTDQTYTES